MNSFLKGVLLGVGVGLLVAPMKGEEMRTLLAQRFEEVRGYLPENEQLTHYTQQISNRMSQVASNVKGYAQQAASTVRESASNLGSIAQNASSDVRQAGRDVANTARQAAQSNKAGSTTTIMPETGTSR